MLLLLHALIPCLAAYSYILHLFLYFLVPSSLHASNTLMEMFLFSCFTGFSLYRELNMGSNAKYNSNRMIEEWLSIMSNVIEDDLLKLIQVSPTIALMCDESTDISVSKELILYVCIIACGRVSVHFLKLIQIPDGRAETIENAMISFLDKANIPVSNITSFGSGVANVMLGHVSGVAA